MWGEMMGPEANFFVKYAPYYVPILAAILLIIFTKNYLFKGMISTEMHEKLLDREGDMVTAMRESASHLDKISQQVESITRKSSEEIKEQSDMIRTVLQDVADGLRTLEDVIKQLAFQCEKHRKNIPETEVFLQQRKKS